MFEVMPLADFSFAVVSEFGTMELSPWINQKEQYRHDEATGKRKYYIEETFFVQLREMNFTINGKNYSVSGTFTKWASGERWSFQSTDAKAMTDNAKLKISNWFIENFVPYLETMKIWDKLRLNYRVNDRERNERKIKDLLKEIQEVQAKIQNDGLTSGELTEVYLYRKGNY